MQWENYEFSTNISQNPGNNTRQNLITMVENHARAVNSTVGIWLSYLTERKFAILLQWKNTRSLSNSAAANDLAWRCKSLHLFGSILNPPSHVKYRRIRKTTRRLQILTVLTDIQAHMQSRTGYTMKYGYYGFIKLLFLLSISVLVFLIFFLYSTFLFLVPCGRLSWFPHVSFWAHVKQAYRIVSLARSDITCMSCWTALFPMNSGDL